MSRYIVVHHDCELHTHDYVVYGPFGSRGDAEAWIERNDMCVPMDGGYAFAAIVGPDVPLSDPAEVDADREEMEHEDQL